jgi:hypothetical protein
VTKAHIVEIFGLGCESLKITNPRLHPNTKKKLVKFYWQVYGTTILTNNEFYLWFVKGYIVEHKSEDVNWAKNNHFYSKRKGSMKGGEGYEK